MQGIIQLFPCNVECVSSASYGDRPTAICFEDQRLEIIEVLQRWRSPEGINFNVLTSEEYAYELNYNQASDQWSCRRI
jgi:hypothetical protein